MNRISATEATALPSTAEAESSPAGRIASQEQRRNGLIVGVAITLLAGAFLPVAGEQWPKIAAFIPTYQTSVIFCYSICAYLILGHYRATRSQALLHLGCGCLYTAVMLVAQFLSFPGMFAPQGLLTGGAQTTSWLWFFWHLGPVASMLLYVWSERRRSGLADPKPGLAVLWGSLAVVIAAAASVAMVTVGHDWLPVLDMNGDYSRINSTGVAPALQVLIVVAFLWLWRSTGFKTVLQVWIGVALVAHFWDNALTMAGGTRLSIGWYVGRFSALVSSAALLFVYLREINQAYQRSVNYGRELAEAKDLAERANQAKGDFLATMSHEIRTPMNAILGTAQILERSGLDGDRLHLVRTIRTAGRGLLAIINDVLDFSKIEAGRFELERSPFVLHNVMSSLIDVLTPYAASKGLKLRLSALPDPALALMGDAQRLGQVLFNLTGNAIKFTPGGSITVSVIVVETRPGHVSLRFTVADTGIGIPADQVGRIFEAFVQAGGQQQGGTGLGLAICHQLVTLMGGKIGVNSRFGQGSEFWFEVPFETVDLQSSQDDKGAIAEVGRRLAGLHVLVVDDSFVNQDIARRLLTLEGATTESADNGRQAVERLRRGEPDFDVVLMDVQMPEMDGLSAAECIRSELALPDLPIIALTAGTLPSQRERAFAAGMNDFIAKPFELDAMVAAILRHSSDKIRTQATAHPEPAPAPKAAAGAFPEVPGIDTVAAAGRLLGNDRLFLGALRALRDEFADVVDEIRKISTEDRPAAIRRLHKLQGVAGNLSANRIADLAAQLGKSLAAEPHLAETEALLEKLRLALKEVLEGLPPEIDMPYPTASAPRPDKIAEFEPGHLRDFIAALATGEIRGVKLFDSVRAGLLARHGDEEISRLDAAVQELRFDDALTQLGAWYPELATWGEVDVV